MMSFWVFAALLIIIALCYVLPPLLQRVEQVNDERKRSNVSIYRDQFDELDRDLRDRLLDKEQYEQGRLELQRRLLEDVAPAPGETKTAGNSTRSGRNAAVIFGTAIPLFAVLLYYQIGTPQALTPGQQQALPSQQAEEVGETPASQPGMPSQQQIEQRVAGLAARLKENPNDAKGWAMLARSYQSFNRYKEASEAYARAAELTGNDAELWADYAETLALANDSRLQGRPVELINKALQLDPQNQKALWLAGNAAFQAQDFQQAISYWEKLEKLLPEGSEGAQSVATSIEEAKGRISGKQ
ncbi:MAG: cytochrome c-type biosis protein CcmH [Acidobacteriota bacterium]|jgi:cytochrome c-type biogenesis protein CcmH|nr:cytochrome c-type biosis protein CcmH [Acidobacteriota bacterium]